MMSSDELRTVRERLADPGGALAPLIARAQATAEVEGRVRALLGEPLAGHLRAVLLDDRRLVLIAEAPAWAARARFAQRAISAGLARAGVEIASIRVITRPPQPEPAVAHRGPARLSAASAALLRAVAAGLDDGGLRRRLLRLAERAGEAPREPLD